MAKETNIELKVGVLVLVCAGLLMGFIWVLGDFGGGSSYVVHVDYPTASDIKPGAPIKVAGVGAGKVQKVEYWGGKRDPEVGRHVTVRVTLGLEEAVGTTLHEDAQFYISTLGVLGEKYVEVDPGTPTKPSLPNGAKVVGQPPLRMEILAQQLTRVAGVVTRILESNEGHLTGLVKHADETLVAARRAVDHADEVLTENRPGVKKVIDWAAAAGPQVDKLLGSARHAIGDGGAVRRTVENTEKLTGTLRREAGPILADAKAAAGNVRAYSGQLRKEPTAKVLLGAQQHAQIAGVLTKADGAMKDVKSMTGQVRDGKGSLGGVVSDNELFMDVKLLVKDLKRHPWKFIWRE